MVLELLHKKMSAILFIFTFMIAYVTAYLPPYIHPCGCNDPNYNQCVKNNIDDIKDKICTGMPELNVLPLEPLIIKYLTIIDADGLKVNLKDVKIYGFCDFVVNSVYTDPDKHHFNLDSNFKRLHLNGTIDLDLRILMQITHQGTCQITVDNVDLKTRLDLKTITKNGKKYIYATKLSMNIDIKDFIYKIDDSRKELTDFYKIIKNIINNNKETIVKRVKPSIEKEISENIISVLNHVFRRINYEELFPEKTRIV